MPGEREFFESQGIDYDDMVLNGPWAELAAWRAAEIAFLLGQGPWTDLGLGLAGTGGVAPALQLSGPLTDGSTITMDDGSDTRYAKRRMVSSPGNDK